jgi:hypothetical protein
MFQPFECHHDAVTAIVTSLQKFVNCIVIARRHNDVQVMRVTELSKPLMNVKIVLKAHQDVLT